MGLLATYAISLIGISQVVSLTPKYHSLSLSEVNSPQIGAGGEGDNGNHCELNCFRNTTSVPQNSSLLCGSDGVTYLSFDEINCVRTNCGRDVRLLSVGRCPASPSIIEQDTGTGSDQSHKQRQYQHHNWNWSGDYSQSGQLPTQVQVPGRNGNGGDQGNRGKLYFPVQVPEATSALSDSVPVPTSTPVPGEVKNEGTGGAIYYYLGEGYRKHHQNRNGKRICIPDECKCPQEFHPLCGSDSVTYGNECLMECNKKCTPEIVKFHDGHCGRPFGKSGCPESSNSNNDCGCPDDDDGSLQPVCGTDNVTYRNRCLLECNRNCNPELDVSHMGYCGRLFFPVVGTIVSGNRIGE